MARPIPTNHAGLQRRRRFEAEAFLPAWGIPQQAPPPVRDVPQQAPELHPEVVTEESWKTTGKVLLVVSGLTGGLAVVSSLGLWPAMAASSMGLDHRGCFILLVSGLYLLAMTLYAAVRTGWLQALDQAPWDARLMAYVGLAVGAAVVVALLAAAAVAAIAVIIVGTAIALSLLVILLLLWRRIQDGPQD